MSAEAEVGAPWGPSLGALPDRMQAFPPVADETKSPSAGWSSVPASAKPPAAAGWSTMAARPAAETVPFLSLPYLCLSLPFIAFP